MSSRALTQASTSIWSCGPAIMILACGCSRRSATIPTPARYTTDVADTRSYQRRTGCAAEWKLPKLHTKVRFPSPAPYPTELFPARVKPRFDVENALAGDLQDLV